MYIVEIEETELRRLKVRAEKIQRLLWEEKDRLESEIFRRVILKEIIEFTLSGREHFFVPEIHPDDRSLVERIKLAITSQKEDERG